MASADGRTRADLIDQLLNEPQRFDFFQAVRLLERAGRELARRDSVRKHHLPVGYDHLPEQEIVHFRTHLALSFPASAIVNMRPARTRLDADALLEMVVAFFGMTGPNGVLPYHYTALLVRRVRSKDSSLRDFLDLFNHRLTSLFYRAWEKYQLPFMYERTKFSVPPGPPAPAVQGLFCLTGLGSAGLQDRLEIADELFVYFSGLFGHYPKTAISLERALEDYFEMPIQVQQLQGEWLRLEPDDLSVMPRARREGQNNRLGMNCVAGERSWEVQSKFRLRVGPLSYVQFCQFMPDGAGLKAICQMARLYAGPELQFDVQPVLKASEVPRCRLTAKGPYRPLLGWNTWASARPFTRPVSDAVFANKDLG